MDWAGIYPWAVVKAAKGCWQGTGVELVLAVHVLAEWLVGMA